MRLQRSAARQSGRYELRSRTRRKSCCPTARPATQGRQDIAGISERTLTRRLAEVRSRRAASRPGWMAHDEQARRARKHHADLPAFGAPELNPVENVSAASAPELAQTPCSKTTTPSLTPHAPLGETSSQTQTRSHPSECATGLTSVTRYDPWYKLYTAAHIANHCRSCAAICITRSSNDDTPGKESSQGKVTRRSPRACRPR